MLLTLCTTTPHNPVLVFEFCSLDIRYHINLFALFPVVMWAVSKEPLHSTSSDSQQPSTSGIQHDSASDSQSIALPDSADIDLVTDSLPESPARPRSAYSKADPLHQAHHSIQLW